MWILLHWIHWFYASRQNFDWFYEPVFSLWFWKKYVAVFDYIDKVLIVLSEASGGVCIISSVSVVGAPIGITGASFTLIFSLTTVIIKKITKIKYLCLLKIN